MSGINRLDALRFKPSKSQRKLLNRWNRFVIFGREGEAKTPPSKSKAPLTFSLSTAIHAAEFRTFEGLNTPQHQFETSLEPSSYTPEKFNLYQKYQILVHSDKKSSPSGFTSFLVDSPLREKPIPYSSTTPSHLPVNYGSYHQLYRLDGQLIAVAVLDILPGCVSSVYFMYDKTWEEFSLGKLSALREISLASEMHEAGAPDLNSLYMGFYIHTCQKMRYKGEYSPSYLADPETYEWFPLATCVASLDSYRYACFSHPEHSVVGFLPNDLKDDGSVSETLEETDVSQLYAVTNITKEKVLIAPIETTSDWEDEYNRFQVTACVKGLSMEVSKEVAFLL